MYVDSVTIAALADELKTTLLDGRVQSVVAPDDLSVGFEIYAQRQRHYLLISAAPKSARCHLVAEKLRRGVEHPSPLHLLLKKYVDGARLVGIEQPPWERIITFDFSGEHGDTRLIAEIMDQRSNIILTLEGEIMDCLRRIGPGENRVRTIMPGKPYVPPPAQGKVLPDEVTAGQITAFLGQAGDTPAWRVLVGHIAGVSPLLAREVIYRSCEDARAPAFDLSGKIVHDAFSALMDDVAAHRWSPCVIPAEEEEGYRAFAAYRLTHLGACSPAEGISAAMAAYFGAPVREQAYQAGKQPVAGQIEAARKRVSRKLAALDRETATEEDIELLRKQAELLLAYGPTLRPDQTFFQAQYEPGEPLVSIEIDPNLTPVENANRYFERYGKAKRAAADVPKLRAATAREIAYLDQLATDLDLAESWPEIDAVREELQKAGYWQGQKTRTPRSGKPGIRRITTDDGFVILVGRNAEQNHALVTEKSKPGDLWVHVRDLPGSHVIIRNDGRPIPEAVITRAAELAAQYSAGRGEASVEVDVTERRYVRPVKGGRPGQVTYKNERVVTVRARDE
ncbi:MAG: NFACT family protein [Anaerolineae bacterium]|nr:NFACT family protein [Anaerolineae bacterium]